METELLSQIVSGGPETKEEETGEAVDGAAATEIGMLTEEGRTAWVIVQETEAVLSLGCTSCHPCPWVQLLLFAVYAFVMGYLDTIHSSPRHSVIL